MFKNKFHEDRLSLIDVANSRFYSSDTKGAFLKLTLKNNTAEAFEVDRKNGLRSKINLDKK